MAFRTVMITRKCYLQVKNKQLQILQDETRHTLPLEDIACIILDNYAISLSANLLACCASNNIAVISCDNTHLPNGVFNSYLPHSRQTLVLDKQLKLSQPFKKRMWQKIVTQKITNQAVCLQRLNQESGAIAKLLNLAQKVNSGDSNNYEAQASKIYFNYLFGQEFRRIKKTTIHADIDADYQEINASLNYTYSILRSLICRSLVGYGLLPILGLFHDNQLNAFNLADDFIEPFRPFVDWYVCSKAIEHETNNLLEYKPELVNILNYIIIIDDKSTLIINACDAMIKSFINAINNNDHTLLELPELPLDLKLSNLD